jgi:hypothetical protein
MAAAVSYKVPNNITALSSITIHHPKLLTGIAIEFDTGVVATTKYIVILYDNNGRVVANSTTAGGGTLGSATINEWQEIPFTAQVQVNQVGTYWIGVQADDAGTTQLAVYANAVNDPRRVGAGTVSSTFGTVAAITVPTGATATRGPYAYLY